nr:transcription factor bHLH47-like [Ipomoea batatas]
MESERPAAPAVEKGTTPAAPSPNGSGLGIDKKSKGKVPKRVHKAEREKMKREHLNDLFLSLANALEMPEQINGKASILNGAIQSVKELLAQIEQLRRGNATLLSESQYVSMEKTELQDENCALVDQIGKLQSEIKDRRVELSLDLNLAPPECQQPSTSETAFQITNPVYVVPQVYPLPGAAQPAPMPPPVSKPLPRYPTLADAWPSQILEKQGDLGL